VTLLLGNGRITHARNNRRAVFPVWSVLGLHKLSGVKRVLLRSVERSGVSRLLLQFSLCEPLLLEADGGYTGIVREPRVRGTPTVGSRYEAMSGKDTAD
jgi:hypothetical protein